MIKEAYVSFEVAKLLKEKGFDEPCATRYCTDGSTFDNSYFLRYKNSEINKDACNAPTNQLAMAWLREKHDIIIIVEPHSYDYVNSKTSSYVFCLWCGDNYEEVYSQSNSELRGKDYHTYEDAVEAALKYVLENLI